MDFVSAPFDFSYSSFLEPTASFSQMADGQNDSVLLPNKFKEMSADG
jgi:hypothetical protein